MKTNEIPLQQSDTTLEKVEKSNRPCDRTTVIIQSGTEMLLNGCVPPAPHNIMGNSDYLGVIL